MNEPAVRLTDVSKKFQLRSERRDSLKERLVRGRSSGQEDFWALRDATFEVPKGSCFGLVGHNGSGKSTALKVMAGIYRPTSGTVVVNGRMSALLELGAGFHPELTGRENIALNGALLGLSRSQIDAATASIIEFSGLQEFIDVPVKVYSSGMHVRLGFAIAVAVDPEILVVDEVIAVGDEEFQRKCMDYFHELRQRGSTVILVSHGMSVMSELCDEAVWLDHGRIRKQGSGQQVVNAYMNEVNNSESRIDESGLVHVGNGGATITSVEIFDPETGELLPHLVTGQRGALRLAFTVDEELKRVVAGFEVCSEVGVVVTSVRTSDDTVRVLEPGPGELEFRFDRCVLNPGSYELSVGLFEDGAFIDYIHRGFTVRVRGDGHSERGLIRMEGAWSRPR